MNTKLNWPVFILSIFSLLVLGGLAAAYIIYIGQPSPLETPTNLLSSGFALLATWLAIKVWNLQENDNAARQQWAALTIGIGMWTMAELLWAFLSYVMEETPYPSVADAFWVLGYGMVLAFAVLRYRSLKIQWRSKTNQVLLVIFAVIFVVVFGWVLLPILTSADQNSLLISGLNTFYVMANLLALFASMILTLSFAGGRFSTPWMVLAAGLAVLSTSDILFIYADWNGLYSPNGTLTWLTALIDIGNLSAYILVAFGVLLNERILIIKDSQPPNQTPRQLDTRPANTQKAMIFIDDRNKVVFANYTLSHLLLDNDSNPVGMSLGDVLGIAPSDMQRLLIDLKSPGVGKIEKYITQYHANGTQISGWLRGQSNFNDLAEYTGADITCEIERRTHSAGAQPAAENFIVSSHTLVLDSQEEKFLLEYFGSKVCALQQAVSEIGGAAVASTFREVFQAAAKTKECVLKLQEGQMWVEKLPSQPQAYAAILAAVIDYARGTLSTGMVQQVLQRLDDKTDSKMLAAARKFGLTE